MNLQVRANRRLGWVVAGLLIALFSIWMRAGFPVTVRADAVYDDELFLNMARSLGAGHWLGLYNNTTLAKGMFYPLFIVVAFVLHIPLKVAEQLIYLGASGFLCWLVARGPVGAKPRPWLGVALFAVFSLNPVPWWPELLRVIREGLYVSLSMGVLGLSVMCSFPRGRSFGRAVVCGAGLGFTGGAFWITREEGLWLVPTALCVAAMGVAWEAMGDGFAWPWRLPRLTLVAWGVAAITFPVLILGVCTVNEKNYGVFETNEFKSASFEHAYGALARIEHDHWQRYIVFPKDARERAYKVSPAARELGPVLDGPVGEAWARPQCERFHIDPCSGVHAGWFMWTLREAVAQAGYYANAPKAAAFYDRLAREIDAACDDGRLACLPPRQTLASPFRWQYVSDAAHELGPMLSLLLSMGRDEIGPHPSVGMPTELEAAADLVGTIAPARGERLIVMGWAASKSGSPSVQVRPVGTSAISISPATEPATDVEAAFPGTRATRFTFDTDCTFSGCDLVVLQPGRPDVIVPFGSLKEKVVPSDPDLQIHMDYAELRDPYRASGILRGAQTRFGLLIQRVYAEASLLLLPLAFVGFLLGGVFRRHGRTCASVYALALGAAVAVSCRLVLLSYLDVTSIPSANMLYLSPATPFLILFVSLGLLVGVDTLVSVWRARKSPVRDLVPHGL